jgi:WD40 repeat protein
LQVIWSQSRGILAHCSGSAVVVERLNGVDESRIEEQCFLHGLTSETTCITLSPTSHLLAGSGTSLFSEHGVTTPAVVVWDISTNQPVATLTNKKNQSVKIVAFSPDGQALVAVGEGAHPTLSVWELYEDRVVATLHMDYEVTELVWLAKSEVSSHAGSGEFVACGSGGITFFCLTPSSELLYMDFDSESLSSMNYTAMTLIESGRGVIIGNSQGVLHEFRATDEGNECVYRWEGHQSGAITALSCSSVSPSAHQGCLVTAGHLPHVRLWLRSHQDGWKAIRDMTLDAVPVYVFVGRDYDGVVGTSNRATWHVKFLAGEGELLTAGPRHALTCLAWAPGSSRFATGDCCGNVEVWSVESGQMQWRFAGVTGCGPIASLQFGDADTLLVACSGTASPGSSATVLLIHLSPDEQCCNSIPDVARAKALPSLVTSSQVLGSFPDSEQRMRMARFSHEPDVVYVALGGQVWALELRSNSRSLMRVLRSPDIQITDMAQHQARPRVIAQSLLARLIPCRLPPDCGAPRKQMAPSVSGLATKARCALLCFTVATSVAIALKVCIPVACTLHKCPPFCRRCAESSLDRSLLARFSAADDSIVLLTGASMGGTSMPALLHLPPPSIIVRCSLHHVVRLEEERRVPSSQSSTCECAAAPPAPPRADSA